MLSKEENELLTRTGPGAPMGRLLRRYWVPALLSEEIPTPDCPPVQVRLLGEELVAFRDSNGRIGLLDEYCSHRGTSLFYGRNEECGLRCIYHRNHFPHVDTFATTIEGSDWHGAFPHLTGTAEETSARLTV